MCAISPGGRRDDNATIWIRRSSRYPVFSENPKFVMSDNYKLRLDPVRVKRKFNVNPS
jgi:hypothetical protein